MNRSTFYLGIKDVHTDLYSIGNTLEGDVNTSTNTISTTITNAQTNINNNTNTDITTLTTFVTNEFKGLSTQLGSSTNLLAAYLQQIMKLELTPHGLKVITPKILTCDGSTANPCPAPLAACGPNNCSWNQVGPLP